MDEQFDYFDEAGRFQGIASRAQVHREGLWHRAAHVLLFSTSGELLIQRRQSTKDVCPGAWDLSAAEHLKPGESFLEGAERGLKEELGIGGVELEPIGEIVRARLEIPELQIRDYEFQRSFRGVYDGKCAPDPDEVMETRFIGLEELSLGFEQHPDEFTPWFRQCALECARLWG